MPSTERSPRSPRHRAVRFALGALVVLGAVAAWLLWRHHPRLAAGVSCVGVVLLLLAPAAPPAVLAVRAAWMALAGVLAWINSRIILTALFVAVLTPIALLRRLLGSPPLTTRPTKATTYWTPRPKEYDAKHWEHPS